MGRSLIEQPQAGISLLPFGLDLGQRLTFPLGAAAGIEARVEIAQAQTGQAGDVSQREQEYLAALKKCEPLAAGEKQKCIDAAKKRFGQM